MFNQSSQQGVENHIIFSQPAQGLSLLNMWQLRALLKATGQNVFGPCMEACTSTLYPCVTHCENTRLSYLFCPERKQSKREVENRRTGNIEDILSWPRATDNLSSISLCLSAKAWNSHRSVIG